MKNIRKILGLFLLLFSLSLGAQEDLDGYLINAAENNPELKAKFNEYLAALEQGPQAKALPDPQLAFGYFLQPVETRVGPQQLKMSASQLFPWMGTLKAKEQVAVQNAKAKLELFEEAKSKLFYEVKSNYFNLYFNRKAVEITLENIDILQSFRDIAIIKVEAGLVSAVDEYRIEIEIGELENQLALLKDKQLTIEVLFNKLLNRDKSLLIKTPSMLTLEDISFSKEEAIDQMIMFNHRLLNIDLQAIALNYRKEVASLSGKPSFKIGFDYTIVGKGANNMAGTDAIILPTLGISVPLYRNKYRAMVQEVVYLSEAKANEKINQENMLEIIFENGWKDYRDASRRIDLFESQLQLAHKSIKILETDYMAGNKNFEEILRMERKVLSFDLELEKAISDKQAAISFLYYLMGK